MVIKLTMRYELKKQLEREDMEDVLESFEDRYWDIREDHEEIMDNVEIIKEHVANVERKNMVLKALLVVALVFIIILL